MRQLFCAAVSVAVLGLAALPAAAGERAMTMQRISAASAAASGSDASHRGPRAGHGYSARARHAADCLATHPNYDPRTDRIQVAPGVSRRCTL